MVSLVFDLPGREPVVHRCGHPAHDLDAVVDLQELGRVVEHEGHVVASLHAERDQGIGYLEHAGEELAPFDPALAEEDVLSIAVVSGAGDEAVGDDIRGIGAHAALLEL